MLLQNSFGEYGPLCKEKIFVKSSCGTTRWESYSGNIYSPRVREGTFLSHVVGQSCALPHALFAAGDLTAAGARKALIGKDGETARPMRGRSCYLHMQSCR